LRQGYDVICAATCGNYGAALSLACSLSGLKCVIHIPERFHSKRIKDMEDVGAAVNYVDRDYEGTLTKTNLNRRERLKEELDLMRELPEIRLPEYTEEDKRVSSFGTIRVKKIAYSVPSQLKNCKVRVRVYEDKIRIYTGIKHLLTLKKKTGTGYCVDYRHVIKTLQRKPGAFANCQYKDQLFPQAIFNDAYEYLTIKYGERVGDKEYLAVLNFAAMEGEDKVADILREILAKKEQLTSDIIKSKLNLPMQIPTVNISRPKFSIYDSLLTSWRPSC